MCALYGASRLFAKPLDTSIAALIGDDYQPVEPDERGLWHSCETLERDIAGSGLIVEAPDLVSFTTEILNRLLRTQAAGLRVYILRDASFNASMAPNGMMMVHTGLLARVQNEAQFAAVLGHEAGHYFRKHSIQQWRDQRTKSAIGAFVSAGANAAAGYSATQGYNGQSWIDLANSINSALLYSLFSFSREQEREADAYGINLMEQADYPPEEAAEVWGQLIAEQKASASNRNARYRDHSLSALSTHPPSENRMRDLDDTARALLAQRPTTDRPHAPDKYRKTLSPHLNTLLAEQVRLNDPGASLYLLNLHARSGWTGLLRYYEGEVYRLRGAEGDKALAENAYADSTRLADTPPEAWRSLGYARLKRGERDGARAALSRYLELNPDAVDAAMVRLSLPPSS